MFYFLLFLAIIQATLEFLPISSSAHLLLIENFYPTQFLNNSFIAIFHFASFLAIAFYFRKHIFNKTRIKQLFFSSIPLSIPFILKNYSSKEFSFYFIGNAWLINSIILFTTANIVKYRSQKIQSLNEITPQKAFLIGIAQAFAVFPAISRLGLTTFIAVALGIKLKTAVAFSFIIALIPYFFIFLFDLSTSFHSSLNFNESLTFLFIFFLCTSLSILFLHFVLKIVSYKLWNLCAIYCLIAALIVLNSSSLQKHQSFYEYKFPTMGTTCTLRVWGQDGKSIKDIFTQIQKSFILINEELSTYKKKSSISKFNRGKANQIFKPSKIFWDNFNTSKKFWRETQGLFNPTIQPLIRLWKTKLKEKKNPYAR